MAIERRGLGGVETALHCGDAVNGAFRILQAPVPVVAELLVPAVPVNRSITPDYLISLEDGKRFKTLKRHLAIRGLTPDAYWAKWNLRSDYPMVAPNYSKARSKLAKSTGLGSKTPAPEAVAEPKRGRGRPKKAS
jgi:predicted transcriptional regulator